MFKDVDYWLKYQSVQNFGDSLSRVLLDKLFLPLGYRYIPTRIIGSCLDDWFVEQALAKNRRCKPIFWGCGIRSRGALSSLGRRSIVITAVRGPISAAEVGSNGELPIGDPALLLPFMYYPTSSSKFMGRSICIPHFHDTRSDKDILALSGCDVVVRSNVTHRIGTIYEVIDAIYSAKFVLSSSLHGAIVAAAYGKPFCFWNPAIPVDLPLKWEDFAASVQIPAHFARDVSTARDIYEGSIRGAIEIPPLAPLAGSAPYIVKSDVYLKILNQDHRGGYLSHTQLTAEYSAYLARTAKTAANPLMRAPSC